MESSSSRKSNSTQNAAFLDKLFDILEDISLDMYISWQPDGRSFLIKDVNLCAEKVLPMYFKHNNIQSFIRQLNMYSFTKTRHDSNFREFRQTYFQRGRRDLLSQIKRKTQGSSEKSGKKRKVANIENESKCVSVNTDEDDIKDSYDEDISTSSSCSDNDNNVSNHTMIREVEELRSHVGNLKSQLWFLSERYGELSSSYDLLRNKFEDNANLCPSCHSSSHVPTVGFNNEFSSLPNTMVQSSLQSSNLVRMISIDPQAALPMKGYKQRAKKVVSGNKPKDKNQISNTLSDGSDSDVQEVYKNRHNSQKDGHGLGLLAAAVELPCNTNDSPSMRSSLADLLNAVDFNVLQAQSI